MISDKKHKTNNLKMLEDAYNKHKELYGSKEDFYYQMAQEFVDYALLCLSQITETPENKRSAIGDKNDEFVIVKKCIKCGVSLSDYWKTPTRCLYNMYEQNFKHDFVDTVYTKKDGC